MQQCATSAALGTHRRRHDKSNDSDSVAICWHLARRGPYGPYLLPSSLVSRCRRALETWMLPGVSRTPEVHPYARSASAAASFRDSRMVIPDPLLRRRLVRLDVAYNISRHISAPGVAALILEVESLVDVRMDEPELQTDTSPWTSTSPLSQCPRHNGVYKAPPGLPEA